MPKTVSIYEASSGRLRRVEAFGDFNSIEDAIAMLRDHPARIQFWERDEDHENAADVVMANGTIYAIEETRI
jgi:hypothetical protein